MAYSLNRAQLIGNLTRDPEMRTTSSGTPVTSFTVATNQSWTDANGQKQERAEFHNIVAWRRPAEILHQYARKGTKMYIEGRIQTRDWEGEDGIKRYRTEIILDNFILLDSKGTPLANQPSSDRNHQGMMNDEEPMPAATNEEVSIDDLPF